MKQCPVCEKRLADPLPPFCDQCGWDIKNDLKMGIFIDPNDISDSIIKEYQRRLATAKRNWSEKTAMAEKLRELEQRLDESEKRSKKEKTEAEKKLEEALAENNQKQGSESNWIEPVTGMEFVFVPGGMFMMGDVFGDGYGNEKPVHEVTLDDFYIGKFPVTQGQWNKVMRAKAGGFWKKLFQSQNSSNFPSHLKKGGNYPVENVSWNDAMFFINKFKFLNADKCRFDLPTEAQWEYAARSGGKKQRYAGGENIEALAWYEDNSGGSTHPVGQKQPNGLGLHDMSGNVREWCRDWYGVYPSGVVRNPVGPAKGGVGRVLRGGGWSSSAVYCRSAIRLRSTADYRDYCHGFRLVLLIG